MNKVEEVKQLIEKNNIKAEIIEHKESGLTTEDAAKATGVPIENIIKTLVFVDKKKQPAIVICLGTNRVDPKKLSEIAKLKKPRLADKEELKQILGTGPGETPPVCLPENVPKFIDKQVMEKEFVLGSAGSEFVGLKINPKDIVKFNDAEIVDLKEE